MSEDEIYEKESKYDELINDLKYLREAAIPLKDKVRTKKQPGQKMKYWIELSEEVKHLSGFQTQKENWRTMEASIKNMRSLIRQFALWNSLLKTVEGKFGGGVFNFFKFLKWSMGLNLALSFLAISFIVIPEHFNNDEKSICDHSYVDHSIDVKNNSLWYEEKNSIICCSEAYDNQTFIKKEPLHVRTNNASAFFSDVAKVLLNTAQGDGYANLSQII